MSGWDWVCFSALAGILLAAIIIGRYNRRRPSSRLVFDCAHGPQLSELDPELLSILRRAGAEWGSLGVARAAVMVYADRTDKFAAGWPS